MSCINNKDMYNFGQKYTHEKNTPLLFEFISVLNNYIHLTKYKQCMHCQNNIFIYT